MRAGRPLRKKRAGTEEVVGCRVQAVGLGTDTEGARGGSEAGGVSEVRVYIEDSEVLAENEDPVVPEEV